MKGFYKRIMSILLVVSVMCGCFILPETAFSASETQVDGTTGTPLGGFGTGGVKFNANAGTFASLSKSPADAYDYSALSGARFQFYSNRDGNVKTADPLKASSNNGRYDDDAIWPEHMANLGSMNDINVNLKAFAPLDNVDYDNMSMPYAFYEMTLTNTKSSAVDASCAFQLATSDKPTYVAGKGFNSSKWAIYGDSNDSNAVISVGNDSGFNNSGILNNSISGTTNKVAVKVSLAANETKTVRFVLAWYDNSDPDRHYYLNHYDNPGDIANRGLEKFDTLKSNADNLVTKMRASNLPDWFKNQIQNTLVNLTNNSMYKKDGRVGYAEGQWTCFGTMDQMWHAREIVSQLVPFFAWQELEYWARTQRNDGQIHHDFNTTTDDKAERSVLVDWDDTEHPDYRSVDKWVDLNCGLIISVYEAYQMTGDTEKLDWFWPYLKKAGDRIFKQVELYGNKQYPYTFDHSENSYDAGGNPNPLNASLSAVVYKIMNKLAVQNGETALAEKYMTAYDTVVESYRARYLRNNFLEEGKRGSESYFTGQWLALHLKLGEIWTAEETDYVLEQLDSYYHPYYWGMGTLVGTYNEWTPYSLAHYGGLLLNTRRANQYNAMQLDSYNRQYTDRNKVFNHPLDILPAVTKPNYVATNTSGDKQYISMPSAWRNYNDVIGYHRDKNTKEIWVQPNLLPEMNHQMTNGMFVMPEGYGTVDFTESGETYQNQNITVKSDSMIEVSKIHISDNFGENVAVTVNGTNVPFTREGTGYAKELVIEWSGTLDNAGITIVSTGDAGDPLPILPERPAGGPDDNDDPGADKDAYGYISATGADVQTQVDIETPVGGEWYVRNRHNYDNHVIYKNVDFGEVGSEIFSAKIASATGGMTIQVVLDDVGGDIVGTLNVPNTGGDTTWKEFICTLGSKVTGKHDVVLIFSATSGATPSFVNLSKFKFLMADGRLDRTIWSATSSGSASASVSNAWDGDITTRWDSHAAQTNGQYFTLNLGATSTFDKIVLDNGTNKNDYPRGYEVYVSNDGTNWGTKIASGTPATESKVVEIVFPSQTAKFIKIVQTGSDSSKYWSIYEMNVFNTKGDSPIETATPIPSITPTPTATSNPEEPTRIISYDKTTGTVSLYKGSDYPSEGATVIVAGYTNGILSEIKYIDGNTDEQVTVGTVSGSIIKVFVWDSLSGMKPICDSLEI